MAAPFEGIDAPTVQISPQWKGREGREGDGRGGEGKGMGGEGEGRNGRDIDTFKR